MSTLPPAAPSVAEKGGAGFEGITMLLCENPLSPLPQAVEAAAAVLPRSNHYTEPHSAPLRAALSEHLAVPEATIHINSGSELILRQLFARLGERVHLVTPTYALFPEIAHQMTETRLTPETDFRLDLNDLDIPAGTTLVVLVNPNNPTGDTFDVEPLPRILECHPDTFFLVDEAFIGLAGRTVVHWMTRFPNLIVTRTFSKAESLAGFRVGYAVLPEALAEDLNQDNDAYPLARPSQAAALATLTHYEDIRERADLLRTWTRGLAAGLRDLGVRTFPTETYFFLTDVSPLTAKHLAAYVHARGILVRPLGDPQLGPGYLRVTTGRPEENLQFLAAVGDCLKEHGM
ncbi:MAG: histidinol-phosphate transaminase [Acidimicrobiia bacterium]